MRSPDNASATISYSSIRPSPNLQVAVFDLAFSSIEQALNSGCSPLNLFNANGISRKAWSVIASLAWQDINEEVTSEPYQNVFMELEIQIIEIVIPGLRVHYSADILEELSSL